MLEKTDEAVASLITKFNDVTPQLMETFKQQLQVSYAYDLVGISVCCLLIILGVIGWIYLLKKMKADSNDDIYFMILGCIALIVIAIGVIFMNICDLIQLTLNPDYYIIENYIKPLISPSCN